MEFKEFTQLVTAQITAMAEKPLYITDLDANALWDKYLDSYPPGTNEMYRERREYDCSTCKQFIRTVGALVTVQEGELVSIWDVPAQDEFAVVAEALSNYVKSFPIKTLFYSETPNVGVVSNLQILGDVVREWSHFNCKLPQTLVKTDIPSLQSNIISSKQVFERGLKTLTVEATKTVIELIEQNSLYRGEEFAHILAKWLALQEAYVITPTDLFIWEHLSDPAARIRNTAIGTLLQDLSENRELDSAVTAYERVVAPTNYKRPTALITKSMITAAMKTVEELGIEPALHRRLANISDISLTDIIFVDNGTSPLLKNSLTSLLTAEVKPSSKTFTKVEEISIEDFIAKVVPTSNSIELFISNSHINNLCTLTAPKFPEARNILKWDNTFAWAYNGGVTDSIKERVKAAGGATEGALRVSLGWFNSDDLDLDVVEPSGFNIYYGYKRSPLTQGRLDIDMNAGYLETSRNAVENIIWPNLAHMPDGDYKIKVTNFTHRETIDVGFEVEIAFGSTTINVKYKKQLRHKGEVFVGTVHLSNKIFTFTPTSEVEVGFTSRDVWGIQTENFAKVSTLMLSPNYWGTSPIGNKHYLFMLEGCKNPNPVRGLYNEYLSNELQQHSKVLEVLGNKLLCEQTDNQLSGVGFSSTQRNEIVCKVSGSFNRLLKIKF